MINHLWYSRRLAFLPVHAAIAKILKWQPCLSADCLPVGSSRAERRASKVIFTNPLARMKWSSRAGEGGETGHGR